MKVPLSERPRERLLKEGAEALSLHELVAIILCTGTEGKNVLELAQEIVSCFGSLQNLLEASVAELIQIKGVGKAKAIQLKAAFAIALRSIEPHHLSRAPIEHPRQAYELVRADIAHQKQEILVVILRDVKGKMIAKERIGMGTLSEVLVHPREVFYPAVRHRANSLIVIHNHPSGDPTPSRSDLKLTRRLMQSSQVMGIKLDDHLIVAKHSYVSLREKGLFGKPMRY